MSSLPSIFLIKCVNRELRDGGVTGGASACPFCVSSVVYP